MNGGPEMVEVLALEVLAIVVTGRATSIDIRPFDPAHFG